MTKWNSVKDNPPKEDGRYTVYVPYNHHHWIGVSSLRQGKFDDATATHWMPLPQPPETKNEQST